MASSSTCGFSPKTIQSRLRRVTARFAPSPTGRLHRGHAFSALTAYKTATEVGGRFVVRIEDIDATRCRPEFEAGILDDLAWLGLTWEEPVLRQSDHLPDYEAMISALTARGLTYRCFKTRRDVAQAIASAPHGRTEAFVGSPIPLAEESDRLAHGEPFAWRLSLERAKAELGGFQDLSFYDDDLGVIAAEPQRAGDIILARKDVGVAYHLAVVIDDARQAISHVVRGEDLREATHIQRLLQALLHLPTPSYRHHRLILGTDGERLSKRHQSETLANLRNQGMTALDLRREFGFD